MEPITFPTDVLAEIFSNLKSSYSVFRCVSKSTYGAKMSWDGWDSLIARGYSVEITGREIRWYLDGKKNDFLGLPAIECLNGKKEWYRNGELHRDGDLPSIEYPCGTKHWYKNGRLHREGDLPAMEWSHGTKKWYKNGKLHRDNGLPAIEKPGRTSVIKVGRVRDNDSFID